MAVDYVSYDMGVKHLAVAVVSVGPDFQFNIHQWGIMDVRGNTGTKVSDMRIEDVVPDFTHHFRDHLAAVIDQFPNAVHLIERQPCPSFRRRGNPKCHVLSHVLQSCLVRKGVPNEKIHFVSPKLKLKLCWARHRERCLEVQARYKTQYTINKHVSVNYARHLMETCKQPEAIEAVFQQAKKKDDISDVLIQCLAHHHFNASERAPAASASGGGGGAA